MQNSLKYIILTSLSLCMGMSFLNQAGVSIALLHIQHSFHASLYLVNLVPTTYWIAICVFCVLGGKLGDMFSKKNVLITGVSIFMMASVISALSNNIVLLLCGSTLMGAGAAIMLPVINALLAEIFPREQLGKAMGIYVGIGSMISIIGPVLIGYLVLHLSWRWLYLINIPISIICITVISLQLKANSPTSKPKAKQAFINTQLFKNPRFNFNVLIMSLGKAALTMTTFMLPYFFQVLHHLNSFQASFVLVPIFILSVIASPLAGMLRDRFGEVVPILLGLSLSSLAWSILLLANTNNMLINYFIIGFLGLASSCVIPVCISSALTSTEKNMHGIASGIAALSRQMGGLIGMLMITSIMNYFIPHHYVLPNNKHDFYIAFHVGGIVCLSLYLFAILLTFCLKGIRKRTLLETF